ncbi:hypothetical protein [Rhizobium leguminosarum]|uniref:hypothetical protein n=1 Tax=Rhizobium leguminosarum TaxID=384 RepID=UPI001C942795|nr:hypothetical protein [Rhizobium leguminosarum]MBY5740303.1 hypothetical protein [Rhizobium leguminosarum]
MHHNKCMPPVKRFRDKGMHHNKCMPPGSVKRFRDDGMHTNKELKRIAWITCDALRFRRRRITAADTPNCGGNVVKSRASRKMS